MSFVAIKHELLPNADPPVYRVEVVYRYTGEALEENLVMPAESDPDHPDHDEDVTYEPQLVHVPTTVTVDSEPEDFIFAADDERWKGKSDEEIAALQCQAISEALEARLTEARVAYEAAEKEPRALDVGETEVHSGGE